MSNTTDNDITLNQMPDLHSDAKEWVYRIFLGNERLDADLFTATSAAGMAAEAIQDAGLKMDGETYEALLETLTDAIADEMAE